MCLLLNLFEQGIVKHDLREAVCRPDPLLERLSLLSLCLRWIHCIP
jgi:hypothetical protein